MDGTEWSNWGSLGGKYLRGGPSVVQAADGRLVLFARGVDRAVYYKAQTEPNSAKWTKWESLGGRFSSWQSLGGALTSLPSASLDTEGLLHVFARGPDRGMWHKAQQGECEPRSVKWTDWESLGGVLASGPRVPYLNDAVGFIQVVARASDKAYWEKRQMTDASPSADNSTQADLAWSDWSCMGGIFTSGPASILGTDGTVEMFGRGPDKALWHKSQYYDGANLAWKKWVSHGGLLSTGPEVGSRADGLLQVFGRGLDKNIYTKTQSVTANGTLEFSFWENLGGSTKSFPC